MCFFLFYPLTNPLVHTEIIFIKLTEKKIPIESLGEVKFCLFNTVEATKNGVDLQNNQPKTRLKALIQIWLAMFL